MKRYVIFVLIGPAVGGLILLATNTYLSGYWTETNFAEVRKFFVVLFSTLQFSYLFGLLPCLAVASIDDILAHVNRINRVVRMGIIGAIGFVAAEFLYGSHGSDTGALQFVLYGLVGLVPATLSSWLARDVASH